LRSRKSGFEVYARTDVGRVRERNEDCYVTLDLGSGRAAGGRVTPLSSPGVLLAVCDGLGGAAGGDVASRLAADALRDSIAGHTRTRTPGERTMVKHLREAISLANERVRKEAATHAELDGMGTTLTAALLCGSTAMFGQVGDSRAYLLRSGILVPTTRDQSLGTALLDLGIVSADQLSAMHGANILLQAVGSDEELEIIFTKVSLCRGDILLVCSDGLSGVIPEEEICDTVIRSRSMRSASERLVRLAVDAGGPDNITVVLCRVDGTSLSAPSAYGPRVSIVEG
jgi:protein phosphatase